MKDFQTKHFKSKIPRNIVISLVIAAVFSIGIYAGTTSKQINVIYRDVKLVVDNQSINLGKDSTGQKIEPFIYNGTTYLPVRAVGEALGKEVSWDGDTSTVYIGKRENMDITKRLNDDLRYMLNDGIWNWNEQGGEYKKDIAGNEYAYWIYFDNFWSDVGYLDYPLNGEYKTFRATLGWLSKQKSNTEHAAKVKIYADDRLVKETTLVPGAFSSEITADVTGALRLRIWVECKVKYCTFFDPVLIK